MDGDMDVLAVGFPTFEDARAAEAELRRVLDVGAGDLAVRPVGGSPEFVNGYEVVLGGRIRQPRRVVVEQVARAHGGEVLTDVPEVYITGGTTRPRPADDAEAEAR